MRKLRLRVGVVAALAASLVATALAAPAQAGYYSDYDSWSGHGSAYTYVNGYASCSSGWKAICKVYDINNYTRDYGAEYSRVNGTIDFGAVTGSVTLGWPPSISWTGSGYTCNMQDVRHQNYWARSYHDGEACRVESWSAAWFDYFSTTGEHWKGSYRKAHTARAS